MPKKQTTKKAATKKAAAKKSAGKKTTAQKRPRKNTAAKKIIMKHPEDFIAEIREKAYENYINKGGYHGDDMADWLNAEKKIKEKYSVV